MLLCIKDVDKITRVTSTINEHSNPFSINHSSKKKLKNMATGHRVKQQYVHYIFEAKAIIHAAFVEHI